MKTLLVLLIVCLLWMLPLAAHATTHNAVDCTTTEINAAIALAADGDTVQIPACADTTSTGQILIPATKGITVQGAGEGVTNIKAGTDFIFTIDAAAANSLTRLTALTINANSRNTSNFTAVTVKAKGLDKFRVDHITITNLVKRGVSVRGNTTNVEFSGLIDHVTCTTTGTFSPTCFSANGTDSSTNYAPFNFAVHLGSNHQTYFEDNTCNYALNQVTDVCLGNTIGGGNIVFRYNTIANNRFATHGADSAARGVHSAEVYRNTHSSAGTTQIAMGFRSAADIVFDNTWTGNYGDIALSIYRAWSGVTTDLDGIPNQACNGLSSWDKNDIANGVAGEGYPCLDQAGWYFTGITANGSNAVSTPGYFINNLKSSVDISPVPGLPDTTEYIVANREFYTSAGAACSGASCTTGVGRGTNAARPANCTTGTGYWETDTGTWNVSGDGRGSGRLYKCTATNTWTLYYEPYTYPHPLQGAAPVIPDAPAGLRLISSSNANQITLVWGASNLAGLLGYHVYHGTTTGVYTESFTITPASQAAAHSPLLQYTYKSAIGGTHYFTVAGFSATVEDTASATEVSATFTALSRTTASARGGSSTRDPLQ